MCHRADSTQAKNTHTHQRRVCLLPEARARGHGSSTHHTQNFGQPRHSGMGTGSEVCSHRGILQSREKGEALLTQGGASLSECSRESPGMKQHTLGATGWTTRNREHSSMGTEV